MEPAPRHYVASCVSIPSLDVRGPAYLGYWPTSSAQPAVRGRAELLDSAGLVALVSLRDVAPIEWAEAGIGIGPDARVFGVREEGQIVAVTGYERWPHDIAQLQVFCHPGFRRRGLAAEALTAAISDALAAKLLPQYRARDGNVASVALAKRVGFVEYGWMATVLIRLPDNVANRIESRDAHTCG
jgi:GNAT superfamily N-acetyltransferase